MLSYREIKATGIYWLVSKRGPDDNRRIGEYQLIDGVLSVPVMGPTARALVGRGLIAVAAEVLGRPTLAPDPSGGWTLSSSAESSAESVPARSPASVEASPPAPADPVFPDPPKKPRGRPRKAAD